jgi:chromosome partitioning protein
MTAAQIAARATSDELQRRLLETPIAAATERTLLVNEGRTMGREFPLPAETRVFVVANQKGGVGKTTTTVNVAAGLALYGARILVIDLDPQGNASTALGIDHSEGTPGVYEAIIEGESLSKLIQPCAEHPGIQVVPATIDLAGAEIELVSIVARESRLKRALDAHLAETEAAGEKYDYVFIDCPPSLGLLTVNALTAAREVLVPIQSEYYALEGLSQLLRHIDMVKSHLNPSLDVSTILLTMYDARTKLAGEVAAEVRGHFRDAVLRRAAFGPDLRSPQPRSDRPRVRPRLRRSPLLPRGLPGDRHAQQLLTSPTSLRRPILSAGAVLSGQQSSAALSPPSFPRFT